MKTNSLPIFSEVKAAAQMQKGMPFLRLGFRPFYVGGALLAALIVPLWVAMFLGQLPLTPAVPPLLWHAHEMLFGFAVAIIVGFLLTAGKAWTGLATPRGAWLGGLAVLWLAARVASLLGPYALYAVLDMALLPLVAAILLTLLLRARNYRNLPLALILALLASANLFFHLAAMGALNLPAITPLYAGLALIVMIECVMAGRVIPAFTMAVTPGLKLIATVWVERVTLGATGLGLALWVFAPNGVVSLLVLALASVLHLKRLASWRPALTVKRPILWILHAAYAWIPVGLGLLALAQIGLVPVSSGVHALAVGATGGLIIGMITRTARGHTGRPLKASNPEVLAYALVMTAAVLRVLLPLLAPGLLGVSLIAAAVVWSAAFLIYLWQFTPWLMSTRLDGKDG
ncbi:MAG: NnrS family protein [Rhodoferax sp.]|uniref:NnrS family protein n=1 Tax=Rhodoferax sp. TaxID=50421 RepID=UPI0017C0992B|nr:NnrS family protein [Rhodoferax sp.]NMM19691.1 NnrS family protein [Rhodoferax sp.]